MTAVVKHAERRLAKFPEVFSTAWFRSDMPLPSQGVRRRDKQTNRTQFQALRCV